MPRDPAVRAHFLKLSLRALERAEPALQDQARAHLATELEAIERARGLAWLPLAHLLSMSASAAEHGGSAGLRALVHDTMRMAFQSPVWNRVIRMAIDTFGLRPPQVARWAPGVYRLAFRDTGRMEVPRADDVSATILFTAVPPLCLEHPAYVAALVHALEYFFELTDTEGSVRRADIPEPTTTLAFELRLSPGPRSHP